MAWNPYTSALGVRVNRATAVIANGTTVYFTVATGNCLVTGLYGTITIVMQAVAQTILFRANPTLGTDEDLCVGLDVQSYAEGDMLGLTGVFGDAMLPAATGGAIQMCHPFILKPGTLDMVSVTAGNTGSVSWSLLYIPLDAGATIVATGP